jgi:DNA-binding PadR family transcriptional regulator
LDDKDLYGGLMRLHILHHAAEGPVFGLWIISELAEHGYRLSPGTLYPILHGLERKGYLKSFKERSGRSVRKVYRITTDGRRVLRASKRRVSELFGELFEPGLRNHRADGHRGSQDLSKGRGMKGMGARRS